MIKIEYRLPSYDVNSDWLVGAKSYLVDRIDPSVENILLPRTSTIPGTLRITLPEEDEISISSDLGKFSHIVESVKQFGNKHNTIHITDADILDLRKEHPSNWAHAFTNHLPLALLVRKLVNEQGKRDFKVILPKNIPKNIKELFLLADFSVLACDKNVFGHQILFDVDPWISLRGCRHEIITQELVKTPLYENVKKITLQRKNKIFVSRKSTRRLKNETEIENYLKADGYLILYPENHSLLEQIAIFSRAEKIVAIHGAGLGPLLLRKVFNDRPFTLMELFNPAHLTNVYRVITHQLGGSWVGVRGKMWPALMRHAYSKDISKYSLSDFSVDKESLECAFDILHKKVLK